MTQIKRAFGAIKQGPDPRDFRAPAPTVRAVPPRKFTITSNLPRIFDQGSIGSCTAHMALSMYIYTRNRQGLPGYDLSRLAQYYWTRVMMGTVNSDSGASIRDAFKTMNKSGAARETLWGYVVSKFKDKPSATATADAATRKSIGYGAVNQTELAIKTQLSFGNPIGFGFAVWSSFYNIGKSGVMPRPNYASDRIEGYHAVFAVGYDDDTRLIKCVNSWGTGFGQAGCFYIPYDLFFDPNFSFDHWTMWLVPQTP